MQGLCAPLTRRVHLPYIYQQCSSMQGLCDRLTRGVHLLSIYASCNPCYAWMCMGGTTSWKSHML